MQLTIIVNRIKPPSFKRSSLYFLTYSEGRTWLLRGPDPSHGPRVVHLCTKIEKLVRSSSQSEKHNRPGWRSKRRHG